MWLCMKVGLCLPTPDIPISGKHPLFLPGGWTMFLIILLAPRLNNPTRDRDMQTLLGEDKQPQLEEWRKLQLLRTTLSILALARTLLNLHAPLCLTMGPCLGVVGQPLLPPHGRVGCRRMGCRRPQLLPWPPPPPPPHGPPPLWVWRCGCRGRRGLVGVVVGAGAVGALVPAVLNPLTSLDGNLTPLAGRLLTGTKLLVVLVRTGSLLGMTPPMVPPVLIPPVLVRGLAPGVPVLKPNLGLVIPGALAVRGVVALLPIPWGCFGPCPGVVVLPVGVGAVVLTAGLRGVLIAPGRLPVVGVLLAPVPARLLPPPVENIPLVFLPPMAPIAMCECPRPLFPCLLPSPLVVIPPAVFVTVRLLSTPQISLLPPSELAPPTFSLRVTARSLDKPPLPSRTTPHT